MTIPDRLRPENPDKKQHSFMADLLRTTLEKIYENKDIENNEISDLISLWNGHSARAFEFHEFRDFYAYTDEENFIRSAFHKENYVHDLSFDEAISLISFICNAEGEESDHDYALDLLETNFPNANASGLIYWPNEWFQDEEMLHLELSPEEFVGYLMEKSGRFLIDAPCIQLTHKIPV